MKKKIEYIINTKESQTLKDTKNCPFENKKKYIVSIKNTSSVRDWFTSYQTLENPLSLLTPELTYFSFTKIKINTCVEVVLYLIPQTDFLKS